MPALLTFPALGLYSSHPVPHEGRLATSQDARRDAVDAAALGAGGGINKGDTLPKASVHWFLICADDDVAADGPSCMILARRPVPSTTVVPAPDTGGHAKQAVKPLRAERRMFVRRIRGDYARVLTSLLRTRLRMRGASGVPRPHLGRRNGLKPGRPRAGTTTGAMTHVWRLARGCLIIKSNARCET